MVVSGILPSQLDFITNSCTLPLWVGYKGARTNKYRRYKAGKQIPDAYCPRRLQVVGRESVGWCAVRDWSLGLYPIQGPDELEIIPVEHHHGAPFVQARQIHRPHVYGSCQQVQIRGRNQLDRHEDREREHERENCCLVNDERPRRPSRPQAAQRKYAQAPEDVCR